MRTTRRALLVAISASLLLARGLRSPAQEIETYGSDHFARLAEVEKATGKPVSQQFYFQIGMPREVGWDAMSEAIARAMEAPWDEPVAEDAGFAATLAAQAANLDLLAKGIAAENPAYPPLEGVDTPALSYQSINLAWRTKLAKARLLARGGDLAGAFDEAIQLLRFARHLRGENALLVDYLNGESVRDHAARFLLELAAAPDKSGADPIDRASWALRVVEANRGGQSSFDCWRMEMLVMRQTFLAGAEEFWAALPTSRAGRVAACRLALAENPRTVEGSALLTDEEALDRCSIAALHRYFDEYVQVGADFAALSVVDRMAQTSTQNDRAHAASPFRHGLVQPMRLAALPVVLYRSDFNDAKLRMAVVVLCLRAADKASLTPVEAVVAAGLDPSWAEDAFIGAAFALAPVEGAPGRWRLTSRAVEELSARQAEFGMPGTWLERPLAVEWGEREAGGEANRP